MRWGGICIAMAACQPLITIEADPNVVWIAVVSLDSNDAVIRATGLLPSDAPLHVVEEGFVVVYGFGAEIDPAPDLSEPLRSPQGCDAVLAPIWAARRTDEGYEETALDSLPAMTATWLGSKCPAERICLSDACVDAIVDIDAGSHTVCGLWASGKISCWGKNGAGETGRSEENVYLQLEAALVEGIDDAEELFVGDEMSCVRRQGGRVTCWGPDYQGEALMMTASLQGPPRPIMGVDSAVAISVGDHHGCVVTEAGGVECWGRNDYGELGDHTMERRGIPVAAIGVGDATDIGSGSSHNCALTGGGQVLCFGSNLAGQLGQGSEPLVEAIGGGAISIDVGTDHSCSLIDDGGVSCWGGNNAGQLGGGDVQLSAPALAVDLAGETSCALLEGGVVECWGASRHGQLGELLPFPFFSGIPIRAPVETMSIDVAAGEYATCTLDVDRDVWCWGSNAYAALGNGSSGNVHERQTAYEGNVVKISAGDEMTFVLLEDGSVTGWGHNHYGQLGRGFRSVMEGPGRVMLTGRAVDVDGGAQHACAIIEGGDVYCWGVNFDDQVGPFGGTVIDSPMRVLGGAVDLAVGDNHSCAILATGQISCWGWNYFGQVGHDTPETPTVLSFVSDAMVGDAGYDQTCILRRDRSLVGCWGRESILEDFTAEAIEVGRSHTCALDGGQIYCWGTNDHGQLGDGTIGVNHARPMPVLGIGDARRLIMGSSHACTTVGEEAAVWCWGDNLASQLNDGNWPDDRATPAPVPGLEGVRFGGGYRHSCVYRDGVVECWGWNEWGQVSFETSAIQVVPSRVMGLEPF